MRTNGKHRAWLVWLIALVVVVSVSEAAAQVCRGEQVNRKGTAGADIAISNVAVTIAEENAGRCALFIHNNGADLNSSVDATIHIGAPWAAF